MNADGNGDADREIWYEIRQFKRPGQDEYEARVVWKGTEFQLQPHFTHVYAFLKYLEGCWASDRRNMATFRSVNVPREFNHLSASFPLRKLGESENNFLSDESASKLVPFVRWCTQNLKEGTWHRFMLTQRQQRHKPNSRRRHMDRVGMTLEAHVNLKEIAQKVGLSISTFLEALRRDENGALSLDAYSIRSAKEREERANAKSGKS